jgi:TfoX/Sxy family transcriptional regulator of competence genes
MTSMKMPKPTEAHKALFRSLLPEGPGVTQRPMFGQLAGFVNGNMFLCLFGDRIAVKLREHDAAELLRVKGAEPFEPMAGRPMRGYVTLPESWHENAAQAEEWVARSVAFVGSLPPKAKPVKKPTKKK